MRRAASWILVLSIILLFSGSATAELYKWVNEKGRVQCSNHPPPEGASTGDVTKIRTYVSSSQSDNSSDVETPEAKSVYSSDPPSIEELEELVELEPYESSDIELYVTSWCKYCKKARDYLNSQGVYFTEFDIEKDKGAAIRKYKLSGRTGVPFAVINGQKIHGFVESAYDRALRLRE